MTTIHGLAQIGFGGDYNPEQWPDDIRLADLDLMGQAGVNIVSLAIFSWASIEPTQGVFEWEWLDTTMDRLHKAGVRVALATATASPPPWLCHAHPDILPRTADGVVLSPGGRQHYAVSSASWRQYAVRMATLMAQRYRQHPALVLWHVDNEIGCHQPHDYSDSAAIGFRRWLRQRYGSIAALNQSWGTQFWSQRYSDFNQVLPPRTAPTYANPSQQLDFARYSSDELLGYFTMLRDAIRPITPTIPITTNFMCGTAKWMDYFRWATEVDVVANDHYTVADDPDRHIDLAFAADLTRGVAGGKPWILMEHSTGAVNWQPRNRAKGPGELLRNSLAHIARGADAAMFFQWRASAAGAEKFHSALVPHAGADSKIFQDSVALGATLKQLAPLVGTRVHARAALVWDYQAWWAAELDSHPSQDVRYPDRARAFYTALWNRGITVDIVHPGADLDGYDLIVVPTLYLITDGDAANIAAAAHRGASIAITYFSGIVDDDDQIRLGGYPGAFRELLGTRTDEFFPLLAHERLTLDDGTTARLWTERVSPVDADTVRRFVDGPMAGGAAITRRAAGDGAAWYVATHQDQAGTAALVDALIAESGVAPVAAAPSGVEIVRRSGAEGSFVVVINHTDAEVRIDVPGTDLLTGSRVQQARVASGGCAVLAE
ncbi:MAG: beta-galactosidase [Beutenbergiaceae bacterium]